MKFIKTAKNGLFYPILGVFLATLSLSLINSPLKAMERQVITELEDSTLPTPTLLQTIPPLRTGTMAVAPEMSNSSLDEVTDDETRIYLPESKKVKNVGTASIEKFPCTYEGCTHKASTKSNLNQHMLKHTTPKRFKCSAPDCKYAAYFKCHIRVHMKNTHKLENQ